MTNVVELPTRLTAEESEVLKWEPLACALYKRLEKKFSTTDEVYKAIKRLKKEFGADDEVMIRVLGILVQSFADEFVSEIKHELERAGDGDDDAAWQNDHEA